MLSEVFTGIYEQNLEKVVEEINNYDAETDIWVLQDGISNSGGTLALHLIGNIKHYFGAVLGKTGFERQRDGEFADRNVSREEIVAEVKNAIDILKESLKPLSDDDFEKPYPEELGGETRTILEVSVYMLTHFNYHLGQINYHRRLLSK